MASISTTITTGVTLATTGSYASPLTIAAQGYINDTGDAGNAILGPSSQAWTVANYGRIRSTGSNGIDLKDGGLVTNGVGATISGNADAILIGKQTGTVINAGTITAAKFEGVYLNSYGYVSNASTGVISGADEGVYAANKPVTVVNAGTISGSVFQGIYLYNGGAVCNTGGLISGGREGILVTETSGSVGNSGTIAGNTAPGVYLAAGGTITNSVGGLIEGANDGIYVALRAATITNNGVVSGSGNRGVGITLGGGGTVINGGTITGAGGTAILFGGGGTNLLVLDPGFAFGGIVAGSTSGGASNTLELASASSVGTVSGLGTAVTNFATLQFDSGARWTAEGSIAGIPGLINGFAAGDTIDVDGFVAVDKSYTGTALVLTDAASNSVTLGIQGTFTTSDFVLSADNAGGTDVSIPGGDTSVPSETLGGPYSGNENSVVPLGGVSVSVGPNADDPLSVTLSVASGTLSAGGQSGGSITLSGAAPTLDAAFAGLVYSGAANFYGSDTLSVTTSDTANGSSIASSTAIVLADTSQPSETLGGPYSGNENSVVPLGGISVSVGPNADDPLSVTLSVASGTLSAGGQSGASIVFGGTAATLDTALAGLVFSGAANFYGADILSVTTSDTMNGSSTTSSAAITVTDTSVPSEVLGGPYSGDENSMVPLGGISVSVSPNASDPLSVTLTVSSGTLSAGGQSGTSITLAGTAPVLDAALAGLVYSGAANFSGADTLSMTTSDTIDHKAVAAAAAISINPNSVSVGNGSGSVTLGNGNDTVTLGTGGGTVSGGNGNDTISAKAGAGSASITLGDGNDSVTLGNGPSTVSLGGGNDTLVVGNNSNTITITGSPSSTDTISAGNGNNTLSLGLGSYTVVLGNGNNTIDMSGGTYNVTAGHGTDLFVFEKPQALLQLNFTSNDELVFRNSGFDLGIDNGKGTATPQQIAGSLLSANTNGTFSSAASRFAYDQGTGKLYYDAKGNTSGSSSVLIADLTNKPHLTAANLFFTS